MKNKEPSKKRKLKRLLTVLILVLIAGGAFFGFTRFRKNEKDISYEFTTISRGNIENTVSSSGTLEPVGIIDVLAQMSGTVEKIYATFNDSVTKSQKLLDLNTELLEIEMKTAEASLIKSQAVYEHTLLEYNNNVLLFEKNLISEFDLDASKTDLKSAEADVISAQAQLEELEIELNQYALILSPIDGVVLELSVDEGDTVVGGTSATSLFTLAEDLTQMEIHGEVDELDISSIYTDQLVEFTVDAYPDKTFSGSVREIRLIPEENDSIVTYTVIIDADNSEEKLLPGMTANIDFIVELEENVLLAPTAAFRFQPSVETESAENGNSNGGGLLSGGMGMPGGGGPGGPGGPGSENKNNNDTPASSVETKTLWYIDENGELSPLLVEVGTSDGSYTQIIGSDDLEGKEIILKQKVEI